MAIIEVKGLKKNYGELEVLKSIDLEIEEGQVVCIIGPSGSGKSTLCKILLFILAEMYRRSGGTDTAVPVEVYRQTGTGYRLHHSG